MSEGLKRLKEEAFAEFKAASGKEALVQARVKYLGRRGELSSFLKELGAMPPDERKGAGEAINVVKEALEEEFARIMSSMESSERSERLAGEKVDVTLPGRTLHVGRLHPVTQVMEELEEIFSSLGFDIAEGPEVELDYYNFEALNLPKEHPARDMQDTFYVTEDVLLRTHTSSVQTRVMEKRRPPLRVIAPGTVYRRDSDITHSPMFHQVEGFMVDKGITFCDLKGLLTVFLQNFFGPKTPVRFRPSFFPFTEPSAEVDIGCVICSGKGCRVCKNSGWLEILGSGMIHPNVFRAVDYDPDEVTGFAFGIGIERLAMLKYGIDDLRLFFENDLRFLKQF